VRSPRRRSATTRASAGEPPPSVTLDVHVQPRADRSAIVGWHGEAVKIRLRAPPVGGAANEELVRFVAARIGLPHGAVRIIRGVTSRRKRLVCDGISRSQALAALGLAPDDDPGG